MPQEIPATKTPKQPTPKPSATIEDKGLIESTLYLKQNNLLPESKSTIKFETTKEAEDERKEEIIYAIREKLNQAKQDITELQKAGYNLHLETIKLISIPLKQKVWKATTSKKDLENIFKIIQEVNSVINPFKKENEEKIARKEKLEKEANLKEKQETKAKEATQKQPTTTTTHHPASSSTKQTKPESTKPKQE